MPDRLKNALPGGLPKRVDIAMVKLPGNDEVFAAEEALRSQSQKLDANRDWRVRISLPPNSKFAFRNQEKGKAWSDFMYPLSDQLAANEPDGVRSGLRCARA